MPWDKEAMKDVARCDKPRLAVSRLLPGDFRMGKPTASAVSYDELIVIRSKPGELKHLSSQRKGHQPRLR